MYFIEPTVKIHCLIFYGIVKKNTKRAIVLCLIGSPEKQSEELKTPENLRDLQNSQHFVSGYLSRLSSLKLLARP